MAFSHFLRFVPNLVLAAELAPAIELFFNTLLSHKEKFLLHCSFVAF